MIEESYSEEENLHSDSDEENVMKKIKIKLSMNLLVEQLATELL